MALELVTVPCLQDNFAFLIRDPATGTVALVDAPEAAPVLAALRERNWPLHLILLTHHHDDHIQAAPELRDVTGAQIWGAAADAHRLPPLGRALQEGDSVSVGNEAGTVIDVPGHTRGHIAFYFAGSGLAFTADSLMAAGCGRLFEGTVDEMWFSLQKLAALPSDTMICSGHDYLNGNLRFAMALEPANPTLILRVRELDQMRRDGRLPMPSRLSEELATNPFLRAEAPEMRAAVGMPDAPASQVFAEIRRRKDRF